MSDLKKQVILALAILSLGVAVGRYSMPQAKVETTANSQVEKNKDVTTHTDTTVTKAPDGTTVTHTVTDKDSTTKTDIATHKETLVSTKHSTVNVSALIATKVDDLTPLYGLSVSKEFIGPVTVGGFALTNGTIGISVGLDF